MRCGVVSLPFTLPFELGTIRLAYPSTFTAAVLPCRFAPAMNRASAATFLPIAGTVSVGLGVSPIFFTDAIALTASTNFALPVATPRNAIVFAHEGVRMRDMLKAGIALDLLAFAGIVLLVPLVVRLLDAD